MVMLLVLFLSSSPDSQKVSVEPSVRLPIMAGRLDVLMSTTLVRSFRQVTRHRSCHYRQLCGNHVSACCYLRCVTNNKTLTVLQNTDLYPRLAYCLVARLHTDVEALLTVAIVRLGQDIVDVMENVALVEELVVGLLELETPAPERKSYFLIKSAPRPAEVQKTTVIIPV